MKGLLPDEEKEKIGPKNVINKIGGKVSGIISAKPQSNPNPTVSTLLSFLILCNIYLNTDFNKLIK